jgi:hypothetical protein
MPRSTVLDLPQEEQAQMLASLQRARYSYLLTLHILLLCAAGRSPTEIAVVLFCSRSRVYRTVVPSGATTRGPWAWSTTTRFGSPRPCALRCCSPRCGGRW